MARGEHIARRKILTEGAKAVVSAAAGAGLLKAAESLSPAEKLLGGDWIEHSVVKGKLVLRAKPNATGDGLVRGVTFTIEPDSAPNLPENDADPHQLPVKYGGWKVIKTVIPDEKTGECSVEIPTIKLGTPANGKFYKVSFDTHGFNIKTGDEISNRAPNGEAEVPITEVLPHSNQ